MNKDVIYIEPEDDITDIIAKIEKAKEKIVALVPPKKAGVFRSIVNIKLIAKAGTSAEKTVVLVTADPSIIKLAAATKLPVAKNLQTAPVIPSTDVEEPSDSHIIEDLPETDENEADESTPTTTEDSKPSKNEASKVKKHENAAVVEDDDEDIEEEEVDEEPAKKEKKEKKTKKPAGGAGNKLFGWIKLHKKLSIFSGVLAVALICFLVWAFGFAPAVDITVAIKTDPKNFSESITFTDKLSDENAKEGKFYLEQKKFDDTQEIEFQATGQKNKGEKAHGEVVVVATVSSDGGSKVINTGDTFTVDGLSFVADSSVTMRYDGKDDSVCVNADSVSKREFDRQGCRIYANIKVTAVSPGTAYNISARKNGWNTTANVEVSSESAMTGGTDNIVTVVQQSDIENAKNQLTTAKADENKTKLYDTIDDKYYIIESSFEQSTGSSTATPAADEEVGSGVKPILKTTTTATVYVIDKVKLEEYIREKAALEDNQKVFDIRDIYIENITQIAADATAKLKAQYFVGPKITESEVVDKVKGKGLGDAGREIRDIYGVSDVKMNTSYPWVMSVPGDSNKVSVRFEVKDQDGKEIKANTDSGNNNESGEDNKDNTEKAKE